MAIDFVVYRELVNLAKKFAPGGRGLMLGRQRFPMKPSLKSFYDDVLTKAGFEGGVEAYRQEDGYSETLFRKLGLCAIETMDFSDFEGADVLQDLNQPVDEALHKQYDFIFDGGTTEHVFNVPVAFENLFHMLKPGGRLVSVNGFNNWPCHGMY
ncbi:MAG: class I SAM-dependent methyltransferase, partial [Pikeienuella sp.]